MKNNALIVKGRGSYERHTFNDLVCTPDTTLLPTNSRRNNPFCSWNHGHSSYTYSLDGLGDWGAAVKNKTHFKVHNYNTDQLVYKTICDCGQWQDHLA